MKDLIVTLNTIGLLAMIGWNWSLSSQNECLQWQVAKLEARISVAEIATKCALHKAEGGSREPVAEYFFVQPDSSSVRLNNQGISDGTIYH